VLTMGLPDSYDTFVIALDSTDSSALTLDYVIGRLLNEESRKTPNSAREAAFRADGKRRPVSEITCFNCQKKGHYQSNCPDKAAVADGGFDAWMVLLGTWCCSFSCYGWINSKAPFSVAHVIITTSKVSEYSKHITRRTS